MRESKVALYIIIPSISILLLFSGCSLTKGLKDDDLLYMGTDIEVSDWDNAASVEDFSFTMNKIPRAGTKTGLFNIYTGIYNAFNTDKSSGVKHWLKTKLGKEPVLYDAKYIGNTKARLQYYLNGKGFFASDIRCDSMVEERTVRLGCKVTLGDRYVIDSIIFPVDSTYAALELDDRLKRAIIREGSYYDRERLDYERIRLATMAQDMGFADFGNENIFFYVDTALSADKVHLYTKVLQPSDTSVHTRYVLDSINIYPNYTLSNKLNVRQLQKAAIKPGLTVWESDHYVNHNLLDRLIISRPGDFYSGSDERRTVNRLLDLGLFRYINVRNHPVDTGGYGHINQDILLTPERMQNISGEIEVNNRSGNFFGMGANLRYHHKNLFKHAERLDVTVGGQVETQLDEGSSFINSSDITVDAQLAFPRFIVPFVSIKEGRNYIPRSLIKATFTQQRRVQYYSLQSLSAKLGYRWRETARKQHELFPIVINEVNVRNKTTQFEQLLAQDARLRTSFDNVLISGLQYYFTYSDQEGRADRRYTYFRGELETSGNLLNLVVPADDAGIGRIAGLRYAQFTKVTADLRRYYRLGAGSIATRAILGVGFSYGNGVELPYIKQYLIGGSNSLRAFPLRGLGPGAFEPAEQEDFNRQFVDQTGDMKLELNVEYRFPVLNFIKGALFVDAGNVWLIDSDDQPSGVFLLDRFYEQIAIGTGVGIRLDFDFFILRFDTAFPIRRPVDGSFEWVADTVNPFSAEWRRDNLQLNLGIGYPF